MDIRTRVENGGEKRRGSDIEAHGCERYGGKIYQADIRRHERRPPDRTQQQEAAGGPEATHSRGGHRQRRNVRRTTPAIRASGCAWRWRRQRGVVRYNLQTNTGLRQSQ